STNRTTAAGATAPASTWPDPSSGPPSATSSAWPRRPWKPRSSRERSQGLPGDPLGLEDPAHGDGQITYGPDAGGALSWHRDPQPDRQCGDHWLEPLLGLRYPAVLWQKVAQPLFLPYHLLDKERGLKMKRVSRRFAVVAGLLVVLGVVVFSSSVS